MSRSIDKTTRFILIALALIMAIGLAVNLSRKNALQEVQWDFKIFYFAAQAGRLGLDPYEIDNLRQVSGQQIELPFVYPPLTVWLFKPFTLLSYPVASQVWLFLKLALLSGLILLWRRHFIAGSLNGLFYLFLLFAFDAAIYWDFKAGNISLVEQLLLWMAFFLLLKRNGVGFGALVVLASTFKVITIVFLVLLPLSDIKHKWKYCLAGFAFRPFRCRSLEKLLEMAKPAQGRRVGLVGAAITDHPQLEELMARLRRSRRCPATSTCRGTWRCRIGSRWRSAASRSTSATGTRSARPRRRGSCSATGRTSSCSATRTRRSWSASAGSWW